MTRAEHTQLAQRMQVPRQSALDDKCAWCWFEGQRVQTFAYLHGSKLWHWCPWHQSEVPPCTGTKIKDRTPAGAQTFEVG